MTDVFRLYVSGVRLVGACRRALRLSQAQALSETNLYLQGLGVIIYLKGLGGT